MQASPLARSLFHRASGQSGGDHLRMRQYWVIDLSKVNDL